jgi:hypothetical protein
MGGMNVLLLDFLKIWGLTRSAKHLDCLSMIECTSGRVTSMSWRQVTCKIQPAKFSDIARICHLGQEPRATCKPS